MGLSGYSRQITSEMIDMHVGVKTKVNPARLNLMVIQRGVIPTLTETPYRRESSIEDAHSKGAVCS